MYNYLGITRKEEISREAHAHRKRKDTTLLTAVEDFVKSFRNPFIDNGADLVNLSTGKACSAATKHFLLNVIKGESLRAYFIQRCVEDPASFIKPITRQKVLNFSAEGAKVKKKGADGKIQQARMERDMMRRIWRLH
jgi:hypothetical protein